MTSSFTLETLFPLAFGIPSGPDLFILLLIVLVLFGAKRLPEIARSLGQSVNEFKKAKDEFEKEVNKTSTTTETSEQPVIEEKKPTAPTEPKQDA